MKQAIIITIIFFGIFAFGVWFSRITLPDKVAERQIADQQEYITYLENHHAPTFIELQEKVGAEPDGIIGPNTIEKWDKKICQQEATKMFIRMGDTE